MSRLDGYIKFRGPCSAGRDAGDGDEPCPWFGSCLVVFKSARKEDFMTANLFLMPRLRTAESTVTSDFFFFFFLGMFALVLMTCRLILRLVVVSGSSFSIDQACLRDQFV